MLEAILMIASLFVLGYGFYLCSRMFWIYRSEKSLYKHLYFITMALIISTHFIFSIILFYFLLSNLFFTGIAHTLNTILSVFWLSGAGLVAAVMKYHIDTVSKMSTRHLKFSFKSLKKAKDPNRKRIIAELKEMKSELDHSRKMSDLSVGRELKIIELNNKIDELDQARRIKDRLKP